MDIDIPPNLSDEEFKCFNEIVKPQLQELYSYEYETFTFGNTHIFVSKDKFPEKTKKPDFNEISTVLSKIPEKHLKIISDIYFVSYHCSEDNHKEIKGRTIPIVYKILIYPKAHDKLKIILTHEIGHIVFEKFLTRKLRQLFALVIQQTFQNYVPLSVEEFAYFINDQFAYSYDNFINNPKWLKEFPLIYNYFMTNVL